MIKVALLICTHKRPEITKVCMMGVDRAVSLFAKKGVELIPFYAVSDDENKALMSEGSFIECSNALIGQKHNHLLQYSLQHQWDYMLQLGSDDLLLDEAIEKIAEEMLRGVEFAGFNQLYLAHPSTREMKYYHSLQCFGAGRFVSRRIIDAVLLKVGVLWHPQRQSGLDGDSARRIAEVTGEKAKVLSGPFGVDIKSKENLNKWDRFSGKTMEWVDLTPEMKMLSSDTNT